MFFSPRRSLTFVATACLRWKQILTMGVKGFCTILSCVFSYCLLFASPSRSEPLQAGSPKITSDNPDVITTTPDGEVRSTTYLAVSPYKQMVFYMTVAVPNKSGDQFCWLEIWQYAIISNELASSANAPLPPGPYQVTPWTQPCPRLPVPSTNCSFAFTKDGDMQLTSQVIGGDDVLVWTSHTAGLGATTLDVVDYDTGIRGNLVLYDSNKEAVWHNIGDFNWELSTGFQCHEPDPSQKWTEHFTALSFSDWFAVLIFCGIVALPLIVMVITLRSSKRGSRW